MTRRISDGPSAGDVLSMLKGGDRRSIGKVNEVVAAVLVNGKLFNALVSGMEQEDPLVRMRAADAAEKVSNQHPDWLLPHKALLLHLARTETQQELRWHLAQMLPRMKFRVKERRAVVAVLWDYVKDRSAIVRSFALQALADFSHGDPLLHDAVLHQARKTARSGSPAERVRARRILTAFKQG